MERIICLIIGYAFGLFQTGYFVGKLNHVDIRVAAIVCRCLRCIQEQVPHLDIIIRFI